MTERNTVQKQIVKDTLISMGSHPTADEVADMVRESYPDISRATVYRVLNKLSENGEALKIPINNGADHYDHQTFPHYHVHCSICGKTADVELPYINDLEGDIKDPKGFKITGYSLQFDGICSECLSKNEIIN